jgi:glycosidase
MADDHHDSAEGGRPPATPPGSPAAGAEADSPVGTVRAFQVAADARTCYQLPDDLFAESGPLALSGAASAQQLAAAMNSVRQAPLFPERAVRAGELTAAALIQEILRHVVDLQSAAGEGTDLGNARAHLQQALQERADRLLDLFEADYPPTPVFKGERTPAHHLEASTDGVPNALLAVEELIMLRLANENPAFDRFRDLHDDAPLEQEGDYEEAISTLEGFFRGVPGVASGGASLFETLRAPMRASPTSLVGQLEYIRTNWAGLLGDRFSGFLRRILRAEDLIAEEQSFRGLGPGPVPVLDAAALRGPGAYERFSEDRSWMPRVVLMAKNAYVWLDQLSRRHGLDLHRFDEIPDEELDALAAGGFTGLWLIGVWERSQASRRIKHLRGNPEAVASAYALYDYQIAADLGGQEAFEELQRRAWARGIRMASDMVPNHVGIDGRWVIEHPEWFLSLPQPPYPGYSFTGPDLSSDPRVALQIEDRYWDGTDAAVVFRRHDRATGADLFIYHGNDGTSMPWNDTAQLDYLLPEVREAVIQTILHVARLFPIIRFDAAMTLARQHVQRLWFPAPGTGGAIPSRSAHGMTEEEFTRHMPEEFWREVVDRVAAEVPDTLLLAEAFWMLEGYFVRTLGMHRVYNSAFMHMTSEERNAEYRQLIKNVLEFDPEILKRFVNFMNNPDEETAVAQFGTGDKYFGVCTLMATMPGLPMFGHGQLEGFHERYGMEYRRARWEEQADQGLLDRHHREIFPLLHRRAQFAEAAEFLLYDVAAGGPVEESIYAYSNLVAGQASLVVYNNRYQAASGWVHRSVPYRDKAAGALKTRRLAEGLGLRIGDDDWVVFREQRSGLEFLRRSRELAQHGMAVSLAGYQCQVFTDFVEVADGTGAYAALAQRLHGSGVPSVRAALEDLRTEPLRLALGELVEACRPVLTGEADPRGAEVEAALRHYLEEAETLGQVTRRRRAFAQFPTECGVLAQVAPALIGRSPDFDPGWLVVWAAERLLTDSRSGLALRSLPLEGAADWARAIPVVERHAAEVREWGASRGSAAGLRRLLRTLLAEPEAASLLQIHEYGGITWFDRDGFRCLGRAVVAGGLLGTKSRAVGARAAELAAAVAQAEDRSGYKMARLLGEGGARQVGPETGTSGSR